MNHFIVNGKEQPVPTVEDRLLGDWVREVRNHFNTSTSLISSIELDGVLLTEKEEKTLENLPLSKVESVEIHVCHPRELAEDTLQTCIDFLGDLCNLAETAASEVKAGNLKRTFPQLIEGISVFTEAILRVRQLLKVQSHDTLDLLENDLGVILQKILKAYEKRLFPEVAELIRASLQPNLYSWRESGIPSLISSRDS